MISSRSRFRAVAVATAAAVAAAGVVAPSALAQEDTTPAAETANDETTDETAANDETTPADETAPEDEPGTEAPAAAAKVTIEIPADKTKQAISKDLEENDEVKAALSGHANVGWKHEGDSLPLGMKFSPVTATVTINPHTLRDASEQTFVATDLDTGEVVAEVTVTVTGVDAPKNPGDKPTPTSPRDIAIIFGVGAAIIAALAGMVQAFVPGGWQHVISYFGGNR